MHARRAAHATRGAGGATAPARRGHTCLLFVVCAWLAARACRQAQARGPRNMHARRQHRQAARAARAQRVGVDGGLEGAAERVRRAGGQALAHGQGQQERLLAK